MDHHRRSTLALLAALGAGCVSAPSSSLGGDPTTPESTPTRGTPPETDVAALTTLVDGNTDFALSLHQQLVSESPAENLFVSPYSISVALAMTWAGAQGETESAMAEALRLALEQDDLHPTFESLAAAVEPPRPASDEAESTGTTENTGADSTEQAKFQLRTANALWGQDGFPFRESFVQTLAAHYAAGMYEVDFKADPEAARETINDWVEDETEGKIEDLLPEGVIDTLTRLVLTNAIYFQAKWHHQFSEEQTTEETFRNLDGSTVEIPMMTTNDSFPYGEVDGHQVVELPYAGREVGMVVVLPGEGEFERFERELDGDRLSELFDALESSGGTVSLPKFGVESAFSLKDALSALGMEVAFDRQRANFDGMIDPDASLPNLYIKDAVHKSFVTVDEKGTEAAAATGVVVGLTSASPDRFDLVVDRPFLFFIRHQETNAVLFAGRVVDGGATQA